jgi:hypothetical protein
MDDEETLSRGKAAGPGAAGTVLMAFNEANSGQKNRSLGHGTVLLWLF